MGKRILRVYLAKNDTPYSAAYAKLDLPASPWEVWDAMEKVRLQTDDILYMEIEDYMYLKDRSNSAGSCWPGIKTIARDMNLSRSTVKRALADLEQHGYLAKLPRYRPNGSNTSNLYTIK